MRSIDEDGEGSSSSLIQKLCGDFIAIDRETWCSLLPCLTVLVEFNSLVTAPSPVSPTSRTVTVQV